MSPIPFPMSTTTKNKPLRYSSCYSCCHTNIESTNVATLKLYQRTCGACGASRDEKSPPLTVTGEPAGSMPANTHLFKVFFEGASPCFLRPPPLSFAVFYHPVHCCMCESVTLLLEDVTSHFLLIVLTRYWSRFMPSIVITSSFVACSRHEMPIIVRRQRQWKTSSL